MIAYLGLDSEPAQVVRITADQVRLKTTRSYAPGLRMIAELVNPAGTFKCILSLRAKCANSPIREWSPFADKDLFASHRRSSGQIGFQSTTREKR
jgi:hypothetical protein